MRDDIRHCKLRAAIFAQGKSFVVDVSSLVKSAQAGDASAISKLYDCYAGTILRYLLARVYERELAQDLTQEVFIRVIKGIGQVEYRDEKSFAGWLYTIAGNVVHSYHRRRRIAAIPLEHDGDLVDARSQHDIHRICDRLALQHALAQLTQDQQQVLTLRFFADMTNSEIARMLNRTEGAIKALQYRALQSLQQIMTHEDEQQDHLSALAQPAFTTPQQTEPGSGTQDREVHTIMTHQPLQSVETHVGD